MASLTDFFDMCFIPEVKVDMTAPVTCLINLGEGPTPESSFTVSFYLPEEHQTEPPKPSLPEIFVENRKEFTVFVRYLH